MSDPYNYTIITHIDARIVRFGRSRFEAILGSSGDRDFSIAMTYRFSV